ncbi:D-tyrosyl-tRNA(Tyr) deacylase [Microvenator marinus]|uniref:D-aminoacyl-tRNA deacylase n=1 Tax=Microvenator marinus TaxID=2600177 RepID=A0A5B8XNQ1_9DELT|nr:D-aminoacyl-tRNA deacylase [Microvenator marinus]QED27512.1 D-tyrosyl-tRNA(Tyr) deacylase [Microvenator marinus]
MKALIQRAKYGKVTVDGTTVGQISGGIVLLLGAEEGDTEKDLAYVVEKVVNLRIFADNAGKMNLSLLDVGGELLVISQFTLMADTRKGRRPSFVKAMEPGLAEDYYLRFIDAAKALGVSKVESGVFGAMMDVEILNEGPVTIMIDSKRD